MKKIPTAFVRDWDGDRRYVTREPHPDCAWVFAGETAWLHARDWEGIVWHHSDGLRYAKVKARDFPKANS